MLISCQLKQWRGIGIHSLQRICSEVSRGRQSLTSAELATVATKFGLDSDSVNAIVGSFDGEIESRAFFEGILEPLTERSKTLLGKIWKLIDTAELGMI